MPEIGLMGGSFNPIHRGHVALARAALDSGKVERVLFLPTGNPPHKREGLADKFDRLRMVELAVAHEAGMAVCREEIDRGGVIYTVDTLAALQSKMPDCSLTYLIGADTLRALGTWRRVETVIERCKFLVMMREGETREDVIRLAGLWASRGAQIDFLDARKMDISSTQIREYIRKNQPFERLVPEAVADYIRARGLYGVIHHAAAQALVGVQKRAGAFLDHLLVVALHAAVALA